MKPLPVMKRAYEGITTAPEWVRERYDGCPTARCGQYDNQPLLWAIADDDKCLICAYRCNKCAGVWWTGWSIAALGVEYAA